MAHGSRRGHRWGTWSSVAVMAALALVGPATGGPTLAAATTTAVSTTAPAITPPPPPPLPIPTPGQSLRERAAQAKSRLDTRGDVPDVLAAWGMDTGSGKLAVDVVGRDTTVATAFLVAAGIDPATVIMRTDAPRNRPLWDLIGGQAINSSGVRCSVGFSARNSSGQRFVITAGHCTKGRGQWSGAGGVVGPTKVTNYPKDDFGAISVTASAAKSTAKVDRYSSGSDVTVKGSTVAKVGSQVCRSGSTTGYRCGVIQATNQTVNYGGGAVVMGLTKTNACGEPGDSGGSYITPAGQAQGVLSGGSGNCRSGGTTYFQPLKEILSAYGLTLTTG